MAIDAYQAVLDHFPDDVTFDATVTFSFGLATPAYNGIIELGGAPGRLAPRRLQRRPHRYPDAMTIQRTLTALGILGALSGCHIDPGVGDYASQESFDFPT